MDPFSMFKSLAISQVLNLLSVGAEKLLVAFAEADKKLEPTVTDAALTAQIDGQLQHWTRIHLKHGWLDLGLLTDIAWPEPQVQEFLAPLIAQAVQTANDVVNPPATPAPAEGGG